MEIEKMYPGYHVYGQACPMWVPLVEYKEADGKGADYFVEKYINELFAQSKNIDTVILGCTHYPLLYPKIAEYMPEGINIIRQGPIIAESLKDYLHRHPEIETECSKHGQCHYLTTEASGKFSPMASIFLDEPVEAEEITLT